MRTPHPTPPHSILTAEGTRKRGAELDLDVGPLPLMVRSELCRRQNTTVMRREGRAEQSSDCMIQTHQACTAHCVSASQKYTGGEGEHHNYHRQTEETHQHLASPDTTLVFFITK